MPECKIDTVEDLHEYLYKAIQLEHATIPPYLTALYSIHPITNSDATHILRVIAVEEMLHMTLAANILNAVGGTPDLNRPKFVPLYPSPLPDGEKDFDVNIQSFSEAAVDVFLKIERPAKAPTEKKRYVQRPRPESAVFGKVLAVGKESKVDDIQFYSIGEFYREVIRGLEKLHEKLGDKLFCGDIKKQVTSEYYYSGGGSAFAVTDLKTAVAAAEVILGQGEGLDDGVYDDQGELAHFYRFQQLQIGKYYQLADKGHPGRPTGPDLKVDWSAVYPIKSNARLSDYEHSPELYKAAKDFNTHYEGFLGFLNKAFNGEPHLLLEAVPRMFEIRNMMLQLIKNPIPNSGGLHAAPTFEINNS
jgi:hypothetical protein